MTVTKTIFKSFNKVNFAKNKRFTNASRRVCRMILGNRRIRAAMAVRFGTKDNGHKIAKIRQYLETAIDLLANKLVEDECNLLPMDGLVSLLDMSGLYNLDKHGI